MGILTSWYLVVTMVANSTWPQSAEIIPLRALPNVKSTSELHF